MADFILEVLGEEMPPENGLVARSADIILG